MTGKEGILRAKGLAGLSDAEGECGDGEGELLASLEAVPAAIEEEEEEEREVLVDDKVGGFCGFGGAAFFKIGWSSEGCEVFDPMIGCCCCCCCFSFWCILTSVELLCKDVMDDGVGHGVLRVELSLATATAALLRAGGMDGLPSEPRARPVAILVDTAEDPFISICCAKSICTFCFVGIGGSFKNGNGPAAGGATFFLWSMP